MPVILPNEAAVNSWLNDDLNESAIHKLGQPYEASDLVSFTAPAFQSFCGRSVLHSGISAFSRFSGKLSLRLTIVLFVPRKPSQLDLLLPLSSQVELLCRDGILKSSLIVAEFANLNKCLEVMIFRFDRWCFSCDCRSGIL